MLIPFSLKATAVFTPGSFPIHTYVERPSVKLEQSLRDALETNGQLVSLSGPSKSGKTVLVEQVVGPEHLIVLTGAGIQQPDDIWNRVLDWMEAPVSVTEQSTASGTTGGEVGVPGVAKVKGDASYSSGTGSTSVRRGLTQVVKDIANSKYVVLVDDYHYMPRATQIEAAKIIKEAVRLGVKMCVASVSHRSDDVVRANPELRGRVTAIDSNYWTLDELKKIAHAGFAALNAKFPNSWIEEFAHESAGSPQLMQLICLNACFVTDVREKNLLQREIADSRDMLNKIFAQTSSNTNFRSLRALGRRWFRHPWKILPLALHPQRP